VKIETAVQEQILVYAREAMAADDTREAVGALVAYYDRRDHIIGAWPLTNISDHPHARYEVDDEALLDLHREAYRDGLRVVGYWHSHLRGGAEPSDGDIRLAPPEPDLCMIVAMRPPDHSGPQVKLWRMRPGARPLEVRIEWV